MCSSELGQADKLNRLYKETRRCTRNKIRRDVIPTQKIRDTKRAGSCKEAKDGGAKMPKLQGGEKGEEEKQGEMDERKREKKSLSSPTPRLQCSFPSDRQRGRRRRRGGGREWRRRWEEAFTVSTGWVQIIRGPRLRGRQPSY